MNVAAMDGVSIIGSSLTTAGGADWALAETGVGTRLIVKACGRVPAWWAGLEGDTVAACVLTGPLSPRNAGVLRAQVPWLAPVPLGLRTSAGMGDRLGLATPGHVRAIRTSGGTIAPIFAQQSIREMTRTGRTPEQVLADATFGAFREGWRGPVGADADHLKTAEDIDALAAAGFSLFTIDPGAYVDGQVEHTQPATLLESFRALPWAALEDSEQALRERYAGRTFDVEPYRVAFDEATIVKAAVKYGRAIAHVTTLFRHLLSAAGARDVELEVSVDETDAPTSHAEHVYIATELRRLGVRWVSLAPRFIGRFEKGVDYLGDVRAFDADCAVHAAIARVLGPYKLSLHSGSDKFAIYDIVARHTNGLVHLKTAGTSYLEALRTLAAVEPALFRAIYAFSRERYDADRASYHVSAEVCRTPPPETLGDADLPGLLDAFDAREVLHVTFGSVLLSRSDAGAWLFRDRVRAALVRHLDAYAAGLEAHFLRHLRPFAATPCARSCEEPR
jgi:hypothetical protein